MILLLVSHDVAIRRALGAANRSSRLYDTTRSLELEHSPTPDAEPWAAGLDCHGDLTQSETRWPNRLA
jgi:hypothetical protein